MKKILSFVLVLVMLFSCASTAFADNDRDFAPAILVLGMANTTLVENRGTENERDVFGAEEEVMNQMLKDLIPPLVFFLLGGSYDIFADALIKAVTPVFEPIKYNKDGESVYNVDIESDSYPRYGLSTFRYDWRRDPMDVAHDLNDFIQEVKEFYGADKVSLIPESMGGVMTSAYIYTYGYDDIESVIYRSTAMYGLSLVGELFTGNIKLSAPELAGYLNGFILGDGADMIMTRGLISTLGVFLANPLLNKVNRFLEKKGEYVFREFLIDVFGYLPGLWSFVPAEYYEQAKEFMLDDDCSGLIEKIDVYQYQVRPGINATIEEMMDNGINVAYISHYGFKEIPVSDKRYMADALIDTQYTSGGATCSVEGGTLGDDYVQAVNDGHNHISPDRQIDASTCFLPEKTWFIKGLFHTYYNDDYENFVYWLLKEGPEVNIHSNPQYPQFIMNNADDTFSPMTEDNNQFNDDKITLAVVIDFVKGLMEE